MREVLLKRGSPWRSPGPSRISSMYMVRRIETWAFGTRLEKANSTPGRVLHIDHMLERMRRLNI
jgi:hypothetical protein